MEVVFLNLHSSEWVRLWIGPSFLKFIWSWT